MIWAKDLEKKYIFANRAICKNLLNADTEETIGKTDIFFAERERKSFPDNPEWHTFGKICRDTDQITMDASIPRQFDEYGNVQGKFLFLDVHKAPFIDENGEMIGTVGSGRDITERKRAEEQLQKSEERFRNLYDDAPVGYFEYDLRGNITRVNHTELKMLGYTAEEMIGQPCWKFIVDEAASEQILAKISGVRPPAVGLERTYRRKDGTLFPVLFEDRLLVDEDGHITGIRTAIQDITDRKKNEEALQKSEARYRVLFETISDAVYVHDVHGKLIDVNSEAYERLGYTRDEILKLFAFDIDINYPTADEVKTKIESAITSGPLRVESRHRSKNGLIFNVELNMNVFHEKGKDIFVTVARDITERLLAEKEKEKLIASLNQALTEVKKLSGLLPICCHCKKIRDDKGYWNQIEEYIHKHSEARFSHGICQECAKKLYPDFDLYDD